MRKRCWASPTSSSRWKASAVCTAWAASPPPAPGWRDPRDPRLDDPHPREGGNPGFLLRHLKRLDPRLRGDDGQPEMASALKPRA
ncbi:hypothetical protein A6A40_24570 (plasmid) [Azospirillum humicireducens]|uniref:Uncharacterized protein n=1 Tax=Azospirillum humicireducens TaxID=1226968 RepID=A0A2R4VUW4_9PROT|nr:hypothetical protein A6A40_24570 [Azospirillum humicireducens]